MKAKGQEEIAAVFSILIFAVVALVVFGFLSLTAEKDEQLILSDFDSLDTKETLLVYLMIPNDSYSNIADMIVNSVNNNDFEEVDKFSLENFEPNFPWAILIEQGDGEEAEWISTITSLEDYKNKNYEELERTAIWGGVSSLSQYWFYIPNPYGKIKNVRVTLIKLGDKNE